VEIVNIVVNNTTLIIRTAAKKLCEYLGDTTYILREGVETYEGLSNESAISGIYFSKTDSKQIHIYIYKSGIWSLCGFSIHIANPKFFSILSQELLNCFQRRKGKVMNTITNYRDCCKDCIHNIWY